MKSAAAKRGVELRSCGDLWEFVDGLADELSDPEMVGLFSPEISPTGIYDRLAIGPAPSMWPLQ